MASHVPDHGSQQLAVSEHPITAVMVSQSQGPISDSVSLNRGASSFHPTPVLTGVSNSLLPPLSTIFVPAGLLSQPMAPSTVMTSVPIVSQPAQSSVPQSSLGNTTQNFIPKIFLEKSE